MNPTGKNMDELLHSIPSSPRALLEKVERQRDEIRLLQQENVRLKHEEVKVSRAAIELQQAFATTQNQIDRLKYEVDSQLSNPVDEEEYTRLEGTPSEKRALLDVIKLGIYRHLGALRASYKASSQRGAELSAELGKLREENAELKVRINESQGIEERSKDDMAKRERESERYRIRVQELEGNLRDAESKLKSFFLDQEQFLKAKMTAQLKTDEVARLAVRLEEAEMDLVTKKTNAECSEQKLDILKAEYYELKLKYSQRIQELEASLKASDEKLKLFSDLELESEVFVSNLAESMDNSGRLMLDGTSVADDTVSGQLERYIALPRSRKLAHSLIVTKRCLHLENKVQLMLRDVEFKDQQIAKLQASLDSARQALHNINSPYLLLEKTLEQLCLEKDLLEKRVGILENDKSTLLHRLKQRNADVHVLCKHRNDLIQMKKMLRRTGVLEVSNNDLSLPTAAVAEPAHSSIPSAPPPRQFAPPTEMESPQGAALPSSFFVPQMLEITS